MKVRISLDDGAVMPSYAHAGDAGLDFYATKSAIIYPHTSKMVGTGVHMEIPSGYVGLGFPRSGLSKLGLNLANCVSVIDSGYRGEVMGLLHNYTDHPQEVSRGDRIFQMVVLPYPLIELVEVDELESDTERGVGGFGSSGS